jgi:biopolymer transport protein ExbB
MLDLFLKGGPLMYPLLFFSVLSFAIIVERGVSLHRARTPSSVLAEALDLVKQKKQEEALRVYCTASGSAALLGETALTAKHLPIEDVEGLLSREGSKKLKSLTKHLHLLELIGKISPMVGLSGTVLGLAGTFQTVAGLERMADPSVLAGGIWEALITTVTGLFVAIPALIFFHLYESRIKTVSFEMKHHSETILALLKEQ